MDWFRVKNCHVMYEGHTKTTLWAWIRVMSLTAQLEKMPTDEQIMAVITKNEYQSMLNHFSKLGKSVSEVLSKLLEDCTKVIEDRERLKDYRKNKNRVAMQKNNNSYTYGTSTKHVANEVDKIREDKIREDKSIVVAKATIPNQYFQFIKNWQEKYKEATGLPYNSSKKDFSILKALFSAHGEEIVRAKANALYVACRDGLLWFTKEGFSAFTIGQLSAHWNEIVQQKKEETFEDKVLRNVEERRKADGVYN